MKKTKKIQREDAISRGAMELITAPNKADKAARFYGSHAATSYQYDSYETHVESVTVDGGVEIGPNRHLPHFHVLLTINHFSYVALDWYRMNALLESYFKGFAPADGRFTLYDASGKPFYTDNEVRVSLLGGGLVLTLKPLLFNPYPTQNPYVDIRLYPQDNWNEIIANYIRKNALPGAIESLEKATQADRATQARQVWTWLLRQGPVDYYFCCEAHADYWAMAREQSSAAAAPRTWARGGP